MAEEAGVAFLGSLPIDPKVGVDADVGKPFVISHADSAVGKAFMEVVESVEDYLAQREHRKKSET
jgi:MinD-like ATPase involved in chromosome partitioning or flagellar assembly